MHEIEQRRNGNEKRKKKSLLYLTKRDREEEERVLKGFWNNLKKYGTARAYETLTELMRRRNF
jgi:hypothetical protein